MKYVGDAKSVGLTKVIFELLRGEKQGSNGGPEVEIDIHAPDSLEKRLLVEWNLKLVFRPYFRLEADYEMNVVATEEGKVDVDAVREDAGYPVLAEFAMLVSTLTKAMGTLPLIIEPASILELANKKKRRNKQ